jgi:hypothetical protein
MAQLDKGILKRNTRLVNRLEDAMLEDVHYSFQPHLES